MAGVARSRGNGPFRVPCTMFALSFTDRSLSSRCLSFRRGRLALGQTVARGVAVLESASVIPVGSSAYGRTKRPWRWSVCFAPWHRAHISSMFEGARKQRLFVFGA
ncbi:hypothetical protein MRX96_016605 [Rhipicephalus microplus]